MIPAPPRPDLDDDLARPAEVPWRWWHAVLVYLAVNLALGIVFVAVVGDGDASDPVVFSLNVVLDLVLLATIAWWVRRVSPAPARDLGIPRRGGWVRTLWVGAPAGVVLYLIAVGVRLALQALLAASTGREVVPPTQLPEGMSDAGIAVAAVLAILIAPVTEEVFFRGLLFRSLRRHGFLVAAAISGLVFGAVHLVGAPALDGLLLQAPLAVVGFGLAWVAERWGLVAAIGAHVCFNLIGFVLILSFV
jgi:membrane protease YdiL (CAAX protease family)